MKERDYDPQERMITEKGGNAPDRRETTDAVKRFRSELRDGMENHLRQGEGVRGPLNRILEAAKMRREPVFGEQIRDGVLLRTGGEAPRYRVTRLGARR
jgi:hypothetical protein